MARHLARMLARASLLRVQEGNALETIRGVSLRMKLGHIHARPTSARLEQAGNEKGA